ncbi:hypothetical protein Btru_045156 [Bulinus truncatus]|nr:hypothetical protein Btru_045156 [Bulinus truncatus]
MASSPKDKFDAAVKVIRGLPKNGSFQPSHDLMLKFYSYYKQATEGPCTAAKPGFWDMVNRKKWEAWSNLGDMESETAMLLYVDELKKVSIDVRKTYYPPQIVETMPQTIAVSEFLQKLDNFYEMVEDSENQNTLKILDKPWPNGSMGDNEDEALTNAYNVNELLIQDLKKWQDSSIIVNGTLSHTNGIDESSKCDGPLHQDEGSESETETDKNEKENSQEDLNQDPASQGDWDTFQDVRHLDVNDSETESEEFCDTSDEPLEAAATSFTQMFLNQNSLKTDFSSTPLPKTKAVHFDPNLCLSDRSLSDSLIVNVTSIAGDVTLDSPSEEDCIMQKSRMKGSCDDNCDISMCRGGENDDKRLKTDGSDSRSYGSAGGSRSSHVGRGDNGRGSSAGGSGGGGRRGLFPNPGGGGGNRGTDSGGNSQANDLNEQIVVTLLRLQQDVSGVLTRLNSLEEFVRADKQARNQKDRSPKGWWPLIDLSPKSALIVLVWPFVVHFIFNYFNKKHRRA